MFCYGCGNELHEDDKFCQHCGSKVRLPKEEEGVHKYIVPIKWWLLAGVVGVMMMFFVGWWIVGKGSADAPEPLVEQTDQVESVQEEPSVVEKPSAVEEPTGVEEVVQQSGEEEPEVTAEAQKIHYLNSGEAVFEQILIYANRYVPATRNKEYKWDATLFYGLEEISPTNPEDGKINGYDLEKKQLINGDTKNRIEYEIYRNPSTNKVNKIVSIENKGDYLEITDYYYTDEGKVNFIFVREDINYIPSYAKPQVDGERYYFSQDVLVKWRTVTQGEQLNFVVGKQEEARGGNTGTVKVFDRLTAAQQGSYNDKEKQMINAAYNTYDSVLKAEGISEIVGYIQDPDGGGMVGATITLYIEGIEQQVFECVTNQEGLYRIILPSKDTTYRLHVSKPGYVETTIHDIRLNKQLVGVYQETVCLIQDVSGALYNVQLTLSDALNVYQGNMMPLGEAYVTIRKGINNRVGEIYRNSQADYDGNVAMSLEPGSYTAEVSKPGYIVSYYTLVARQSNESISMNTSPILSDDEVRIVLTWGDEPADLDSHLFTPYDSSSGDTTYHIWYGNKQDDSANNLDVDDQDAYGPETMTINHIGNGRYKYYVVDFTNCVANDTTAYDMSLSGARVCVYTKEGLIQTFYVPRNKPGVIWEVFEIRNKMIIPIQRYYHTIDDKTWWHNEK